MQATLIPIWKKVIFKVGERLVGVLTLYPLGSELGLPNFFMKKVPPFLAGEAKELMAVKLLAMLVPLPPLPPAEVGMVAAAGTDTTGRTSREGSATDSMLAKGEVPEMEG